MAEENKKVSFGFSKSVKKPTLLNQPPKEQPQVDYIECIDDQTIKSVNAPEPVETGPRVIPLIGSKTWHERFTNKVNADVYNSNGNKNGKVSEPIIIKQEPEDNESTNGDIGGAVKFESVEIKLEPDETNPQLSLDQMAAQELIQDLENNVKSEPNNTASIPLTMGNLLGTEESVQENYEDVPIDGYGLALLRGMGWKDENKTTELKIPELRPMNLGMGADKIIAQVKKKEPEVPGLVLQKGSHVKVLIGKETGNYGQIEGFDENAERLIVKMALSGQTISLSEAMIQLVTKNEFSKNAKVLNSKKFEEYKSNEPKSRDDQSDDERKSRSRDKPKKSKKSRRKSESSDSDSSSESRSRRRRDKSSERSRKSKKSRRRSESESDSSKERSRRDKYERSSDRRKSKKSRERRESEGSDSSQESKKKRRSHSNSSPEEKSRKNKKSKKHKSRGSSSERLSKKNRKKDKEREKNRDKYCDSSDRRHHKKHKRSRSRS